MSLLTLKPIPASSLPVPNSPDYTHYRDQLVQQALDLVASLTTPTSDSSPLWHRNKTYHANKGLATATYSSTSPPPATGDCEGYRWHARTSRHLPGPGAPSFDDFERGLLQNHSDNERHYIESCYQAQRLAVVKDGQLEDTSPFPASRRAFVFALLTLSLPPRPHPHPHPHPTDPLNPDAAPTPQPAPRRAFLVVSLPATHDDAREEDERERAVRARYVSVEHVEEDEEGGVVWTMAVSSDAGGAIPRCITERAMPNKIAQDVPSFVEWVTRTGTGGSRGEGEGEGEGGGRA
ncbi:hypothetical protein JCM3775_001475 [Rhodotorula graminis]